MNVRNNLKVAAMKPLKIENNDKHVIIRALNQFE